MKLREKLVEILACPMCGHYPLKLVKIRTDGEKVIEGILYCENCKRWYPIKDEVAIMLPDDMRDKSTDEEFYKANQDAFEKNSIGKDPYPKPTARSSGDRISSISRPLRLTMPSWPAATTGWMIWRAPRAPCRKG